jgi:hypothetical protein
MGLARGSLVAAVLLSCTSEDPGALGGRVRNGGNGGGGDGDEEISSEGSLTASGSTPNELCFNTINEYRKRAGLPAYARWTEIETCADGQAKSDADTRTAHGAFTRCGEMAQNECPGTTGQPEKVLPACLAAMWREGEGGGHYEAMASTKYTRAVCGVHVTSRGATWSVQNFK